MTTFRNAIRAAAALASVGVTTLVAIPAPADAKMNSCALRQSFCNERCIMRNKEDGQIASCVRRTCDHQFKNCMRDSAGGGSGGGGGGRGKRGAFIGLTAPAATPSTTGGPRPANAGAPRPAAVPPRTSMPIGPAPGAQLGGSGNSRPR